MLTTGRTNSRPKVKTLQMPAIVVFISKAGVLKLDWSQIYIFFSPSVIVFLEEVEKDVKDKAGVKIRFLTRNDSSAANQRFCVCEHDPGQCLGSGYENSLRFRENNIFKQTFEIFPL